jgi:phage tail-like protein
MDANKTRYHLLLTREDWADCLAENGGTLGQHWFASPAPYNQSGLDWNLAGNELILQPRLVEFKSSSYEHVSTFDQRRGAGRDQYGNWYWISESGVEIRVQSSGTGRSAHFWSPGDGLAVESQAVFGAFQPKAASQPIAPFHLSGLAVTQDHYLVVGVLEPKGLLIFDLHATGSPRQVLWPDSVEFAPFDMAPRPGGGVWILDRIHRRYWGLDRKLNVIRFDDAGETIQPDDFQPVDQTGTRRTSTRPFPEAITLDWSSPLEARDPVALDALPDGSVIILDNILENGFSRLYRYLQKQQLGPAVSLQSALSVVEEENQAAFRLIGYDIAFVPASSGAKPLLLGTLFVVAINGNQAFAFDVLGSETSLDLQARPEYYPLRLFGGKAIIAAGELVYYDFGESWLPLIQQKRPRFELKATFLTPVEPGVVFDGKAPDCVWHRLMLDACIPPDSHVLIWSRAANELSFLERAAWQPEPRLHQRAEGSELPFESKASAQDAGTWELLFQRARGRYLQLKIQLLGNGRSTPRLQALRAYYPRFSYLVHYLPAVYREDEESAVFLDKFLANGEGTLTALEDRIANVQMLLDVRSIPPEFLDWLAGWLGIVLDPHWDERRRRLFIKHAMEFFQYRGTIRGLLIVLHLALDTCFDETVLTQILVSNPQAINQHSRLSSFRIVEDFRTRQIPAVALGDPTAADGLRVVTLSDRWKPDQGRDVLNQRWQEAASLPAASEFPVRDPGRELSETWRAFTRARLGFVPSADPIRDQAAWQAFLSKRYRTIGALNTAYGLPTSAQYRSFDKIDPPAQLPSDGAPMMDWYEFESILLPMQRAAHRFVVLLPATSQLTEAQRQERLDIAERVIKLEKPAHTTFRVKFYWAMFRLGEARLGEDTLIDIGSRAPDLMPPFILGRDYLSSGYLAPAYPQDVNDRLVLGRDRLNNAEDPHAHI